LPQHNPAAAGPARSGPDGVTEQPAAPGVEAPLEKHDDEPIGTP